MRRLRDFGRFSNKEFLHAREGYNLKFNDLSAALALAQFKKIEERKNMLLDQQEMYVKEINEDKGMWKNLQFFSYHSGEIPLWTDVMAKNRKGLVEHLNKKEIFPREYWPSVHSNPPYQDQAKEGDESFPRASLIANNGLWLPNGPAIGEKEIKYVCDEIKTFYNGA